MPTILMLWKSERLLFQVLYPHSSCFITWTYLVFTRSLWYYLTIIFFYSFHVNQNFIVIMKQTKIWQLQNKMKKNKYHTIRTVLKYHTVRTVLKYHTIRTVLKYHTVRTVLKYHTVRTVLKYQSEQF